MNSRFLLARVVAGVMAGSFGSVVYGQISIFPFTQNFDSVQPPALPIGWSSTQNRSPGVNDFTTTASTPRSAPHAVLSTNATVGQALYSPVFDFGGTIPDRLEFHTRRSATHLAKVVVEASLDGGTSFPVQISDSLVNTGTTNYVPSTFQLPLEMSSSSRVVFRWRIVPDVSGTTGTFRIDDVLISVHRTEDLALSSLRFSPRFPTEGDAVDAIATVKNFGQRASQAFSLDFYIDANNDSLPQPFELISSIDHSVPIEVADSVELRARLGVFFFGQKLVIGRVRYAQDQNPLNNERHQLLLVGYRARSVVVNEIMYAPAAPEPEWVELYNTRDDSISVRNWLISDNIVSTKRTLTSANVTLAPGGYLVLTKDSAGLVDVHPDIPARVLPVTGFPTLNNSGDAVVLYDNRVATMDSLSYLPGWGGSSGGRSLERIDPMSESTLQSNWGTSRAVGGGTPGRRNSLARKNYDLKLDTVITEPLLPAIGDSVLIRVRVTNLGFESAYPYRVSLFEDANNDSIGQPGELRSSLTETSPLSPLASFSHAFAVAISRAGLHRFILRVDYYDDEDSTNNMRYVSIESGYPRGTVSLNEVMYAPPSGIPEWVEIVNVYRDTVDLRKWSIGNRTPSSRYSVSMSSLYLPPGQYAVVTKDTALLRMTYGALTGMIIQSPSLPTFLWSNSGDAVVLLDSRNVMIDSLSYRPTWGGSSGTSLERVDVLRETNDSTNWASSVDSSKGTPGKPNSVVALEHDLRISPRSGLTVKPGESATVSVTIQNIGKTMSGPFEVIFYDDVNHDSLGSAEEVFRQVAVSQPLAPRETLAVYTDWVDPPPGLRTVIVRLVYAGDMRPLNNETRFTVRVGYSERTLVINEIMYAPSTGNAEYVELLNVSKFAVNLAQWKITDRPGSTGSFNQYLLSTTTRTIGPDEFFVLASDSSILKRFSYLTPASHQVLTILNQSSLSLNNEGDDIVLRDLTGAAIDSVGYRPGWHNPGVADKSGRSLERINPRLGSNDARNWSTSANPVGGTPGMRNSIFAPIVPSQSRLAFSPNPFSPDGDGIEDFVIITYELPLTVSTIRIRVYDAKGRQVRTLVNNEPSGARGSVVWDGRDDSGQKSRIGLYVVLLEAIDEGGGTLETVKGVVVLASVL